MRRIGFLLVGSLLVGTLGGAAQAQEWPADLMETLLERYDDNKNGKLDGDELVAAKRYVDRLARRKKRLDALRKRNKNRPRGRSPFGPGGMRGGRRDGPALKPEQLKIKDGAATIPDRETFRTLSYKGEEVLVDQHLAGIEFVKFQIEDARAEKPPRLYFINTNTHRGHPMFMRAIGIGDRSSMRGVLCFHPMLKSPSGNAGHYTFEYEPFDAYPHKLIKLSYDLLLKKMPALKGNLSYYPIGQGAKRQTEIDQKLYEKSGPPIFLEKDFEGDIGYLPLNPGVSFGRLRIMQHDERPSSRDVVVYATLPNEMPRVSGIITAVRQTPLSHVNLRAIQDRLPNAFIAKATDNAEIRALAGSFVRYAVTGDGYDLRKATPEEVETHFASIRPKATQTPKRDLTVTAIRPLAKIGFGDASSVGVKAANVAVLGTFGFGEGAVPQGVAIPFHYYDAFMKHNGFYDVVKKMLEGASFQREPKVQRLALAALRAQIEHGDMPAWMMESLQRLHASFPAGTSLRCRSSTNNEDLPGFSGAGLYDSFTHKPSEGHLAKSIKQVFASMWNYRAFDERAFYRVDHLAAAMGVLVHPNYKGEQVNGVAVTDDILYQRNGYYYINAQLGEDLVTNPEAESVPEEVLLDWYEARYDKLMRSSNRIPRDRRLLKPAILEKLRSALAIVHKRFRALYGKSTDDRFAMEIEFKVTKEGTFVIKQARPWIFAPALNAPSK